MENIKMNTDLLDRLQEELTVKGYRVCGEDIGSILISDSYRIDWGQMRVYTNISDKYVADIVKW